MSDRNNLIRSAINASKLSVENLYMQQWGHAWVNRYVRMLVILLDCLVTCSTTDIGSGRKNRKVLSRELFRSLQSLSSYGSRQAADQTCCKDSYISLFYISKVQNFENGEKTRTSIKRLILVFSKRLLKTSTSGTLAQLSDVEKTSTATGMSWPRRLLALFGSRSRRLLDGK